MGFEVFDFIDRKKAGMYALCLNWSSVLEANAKTNANWKDRTAHARQSIHGRVEKNRDKYSIYISHGVEYGEILEEGSKPHIITPKDKKALYWRGAAHPVKVVNHPGTKGFSTLEDTLDKNKGMIVETIIEHWSD